MEQKQEEKVDRSSTPRASQKRFWHSLREWSQVIVIAAAISLPVRFFIAEPFIVHGASMDPTFSTGQFLIVDRISYRFGSPSRGDVIVFEYPKSPGTYYIKRIIGLPGETVKLSSGKVTIINDANPTGLALNETYIDPSHASEDNSEITLGKTEYFVMGDNRSQSSDSRFWGPLDNRFIVGRPIIRLFPVTTVSILPGSEKTK